MIEKILLWSWMNLKQIALWSSWIIVTLILGIYLTASLLGEDKTNFLPGETTHGHYQIEMACEACHTTFEGVEQETCLKCHAEELKLANDTHEESKFADPRNANMLELIDAQKCVTCHSEHRPEMTRTAGVTVPDDYCIYCHEDIAVDRPSHEGMPFDECTDACHNYHDNTALYEDFLVKNLHQPDTFEKLTIPKRSFMDFYRSDPIYPIKPLTMVEQNAPEQVNLEKARDWLESSHANAGVNCNGCHLMKQADDTLVWEDKPDHTVCKTCHDSEVSGFLTGKHGMRLDANLSHMTTSQARLPMKPGNNTVNCVSCHQAHKFSTDPRYTAVESCLECHADDHSRAYKASSHFRLWNDEMKGKMEPGSGISCATCHLPREVVKEGGEERIIVQHNQNLNLRPNQKMIRGVCMNCHSLSFSLDSLVDDELVTNNFSEAPSKHIDSLEMAEKRMKKPAKKPNSESVEASTQ